MSAREEAETIGGYEMTQKTEITNMATATAQEILDYMDPAKCHGLDPITVELDRQAGMAPNPTEKQGNFQVYEPPVRAQRRRKKPFGQCRRCGENVFAGDEFSLDDEGFLCGRCDQDLNVLSED